MERTTTGMSSTLPKNCTSGVSTVFCMVCTVGTSGKSHHFVHELLGISTFLCTTCLPDKDVNDFVDELHMGYIHCLLNYLAVVEANWAPSSNACSLRSRSQLLAYDMMHMIVTGTALCKHARVSAARSLCSRRGRCSVFL